MQADWARIEEDALAGSRAGSVRCGDRSDRGAIRAPANRPGRDPTIGIGASLACNGQILVLEDVLGLSPRVPKFVKRFGELGPCIEKCGQGYAAEVRARFPAAG